MIYIEAPLFMRQQWYFPCCMYSLNFSGDMGFIPSKTTDFIFNKRDLTLPIYLPHHENFPSTAIHLTTSCFQILTCLLPFCLQDSML